MKRNVLNGVTARLSFSSLDKRLRDLRMLEVVVSFW